MVDQEKQERSAAKQVKNPELDTHAQFLTGDKNKQLGDELAIFQRNPLQKKPGAFYTFMESC